MSTAWAPVALAFALLGTGCSASSCGGGASGGSLSAKERAAIPGRIYFVSERAGQKDVWWIEPTGEEGPLAQGPEDEFPAAPTPDGKALLVVAWRMDEGVQREQLRLHPTAGGPAVPLTPPRGRARNPSFAPDGKWFVSESDAMGFSDLVRMAAPQGDQERYQEPSQEARLTTIREGCFEPAVSPDGKQIAYVSSKGGDPEIYVMEIDGTNERRITTFHREDWGPKWSADGQWIAFSSNRESRDRVYLVHPDGSDLRALSGAAFAGDERELAFAPDGKHLAYVSRETNGKSRIWIAPVAGGAPVALTNGQFRDDAPAFSPDGKYLVFVSERNGDVDLHIMRKDGSGQTRLTQAKGPDWAPQWFVSPKKAP